MSSHFDRGRDDPHLRHAWMEHVHTAGVGELRAWVLDANEPRGLREAAILRLQMDGRSGTGGNLVDLFVAAIRQNDPELQPALMAALAALDDLDANAALEGYARSGIRDAVLALSQQRGRGDRVLSELAAAGNHDAVNVLLAKRSPIVERQAKELLKSENVDDQQRGYAYFLGRNDPTALAVFDELGERCPHSARNRALIKTALECWSPVAQLMSSSDWIKNVFPRRSASFEAIKPTMKTALEDAGFVDPPVLPRILTQKDMLASLTMPAPHAEREAARLAGYRRDSIGVEATLPGCTLIESLECRLELAALLALQNQRPGLLELRKWVGALQGRCATADSAIRDCVLTQAAKPCLVHGGYLAYFHEKPAEERVAFLLTRLDELLSRIVAET
ncbi:MAG TPA: hypothetical protein VGE52_19460 [Pirellulales bacterium]